MSELRTVLVATDFSADAERAARRAAYLAAEHKARLKLLHVVNAASVRDLQIGLRLPHIESQVVAEAERRLGLIADSLQAIAGSAVECSVRVGSVLDEVVPEADAADLLVLGPRGVRPIHDFVLGSTASRVLTKARQPILVVKQAAAGRYRNVLVPVDYSDHSRRALEFARRLAPQADLYACHILDYPLAGMLQYAGVAAEAVEKYRNEVQTDARIRLDELIAGVAGARAIPILEPGDPRQSIVDKAVDYRIDLIVMGKHGRSAVSEHFLGGVTRATLARAPCDVAVSPG